MKLFGIIVLCATIIGCGGSNQASSDELATGSANECNLCTTEQIGWCDKLDYDAGYVIELACPSELAEKCLYTTIPGYSIRQLGTSKEGFVEGQPGMSPVPSDAGATLECLYEATSTPALSGLTCCP